jgi:hypothetical protein
MKDNISLLLLINGFKCKNLFINFLQLKQEIFLSIKMGPSILYMMVSNFYIIVSKSIFRRLKF